MVQGILVEAKFSAAGPDRPWGPPSFLTMGTGSFPRVKSGRGMKLTPHPLLMLSSRKSRAKPLLPVWAIQPVQSLSACTVQLYLYSPYGPYGLYRASVPVQYSYTSTPRMGRTACTEPQCLYKGALCLYLVHKGFPRTELLFITHAYGQQWPYLGCTVTESN